MSRFFRFPNLQPRELDGFPSLHLEAGIARPALLSGGSTLGASHFLDSLRYIDLASSVGFCT